MADNLSGSSGPVEINGKTYQMSPMDDRLVGMVNHYIQIKDIKAAQEAVRDEQDPEIRELTIQSAIKLSRKTDILVDESLISNPENFMYLAWVLIHDNHSDLEWEEFVRIVTQEDPECIHRIVDTFYMIHPFSKSSQNSGAPSKSQKSQEKDQKQKSTQILRDRKKDERQRKKQNR